jgi:hypothetical protein
LTLQQAYAKVIPLHCQIFSFYLSQAMRYLILTFSILFFVSVFAEKGEKYLVINPGGHKGTIKSMLIDSKGKNNHWRL